MNLRTLTLIIEDDGSLRTARGEYVETDAAGRETSVGTKAIAEADLSSVLPTAASLIASVDALTSERDAALAGKEAALAGKEAAETAAQAAETAAQAAVDQHASEIASLKSAHDAEIASLKSAHDAEIASLKSSHDAEKAALQAQIDALKPPTDINGVPQEVSMYQARAALIGAGLYDQVNAAVAASPDEMVKVAWEYATVVRRSSPFIAAMSGALGLDDAAIDQLFVTASQIV